MKCPACQTPDLLIAERQSVEIDYCPTCRGIWLDRGELDKLLARAAADDDTYRGPPLNGERGADARHVQHERDESWRHNGHAHSDYRGRYDSRKKKKSLFEIFDFD
jgi:Zn-finger nucleic acid-binding protein